MTTFVDTGAWYASVVPSDPRHAAVLDWMQRSRDPLVTTDYVIDETLTLLRARGERQRAVVLGRHFFDLSGVTIHFIDQSDLRRAWEAFRDRPEMESSFTDCTSKAVIERLHVKQVLTFDHHFAQFGSLAVVP